MINIVSLRIFLIGRNIPFQCRFVICKSGINQVITYVQGSTYYRWDNFRTFSLQMNKFLAWEIVTLRTLIWWSSLSTLSIVINSLSKLSIRYQLIKHCGTCIILHANYFIWRIPCFSSEFHLQYWTLLLIFIWWVGSQFFTFKIIRKDTN